MLIFNQSQSWKASPPRYNAVYRAVTGIVGKLLGVIQLLILTEIQQGGSVLLYFFVGFVLWLV